jgi:hypothetical protein
VDRDVDAGDEDGGGAEDDRRRQRDPPKPVPAGVAGDAHDLGCAQLARSHVLRRVFPFVVSSASMALYAP